MKNKQSQICEICSSYMQFTKDNTWLVCSCGYMKPVKKRIIKPIGVKNEIN